MTIYAIAIATNLDKEKHLKLAVDCFQQWGKCEFSAIYEIPCRDHVGADYWNSACLLVSSFSLEQITVLLKQLEQHTGRKRPSHSISLDVDLIAWGEDLPDMHFNVKKLPLAADVIIPLRELWQAEVLYEIQHSYPSYQILHPGQDIKN